MHRLSDPSVFKMMNKCFVCKINGKCKDWMVSGGSGVGDSSKLLVSMSLDVDLDEKINHVIQTMSQHWPDLYSPQSYVLLVFGWELNQPNQFVSFRVDSSRPWRFSDLAMASRMSWSWLPKLLRLCQHIASIFREHVHRILMIIITINVNIHACTCANSGLSPPESPSTSPSSSVSSASWVYPPVLRDSSDSDNENTTDDNDDDDDSSVSGEGGQQQLPLSSFFGDTTMVTTGALGSEPTSDEDSDGCEAEDNIAYLPIPRGTVFIF